MASNQFAISSEVSRWKLLEDQELGVKTEMLRDSGTVAGLKSRDVLFVLKERARLASAHDRKVGKNHKEHEKSISRRVEAIRGRHSLKDDVLKRIRTAPSGAGRLSQSLPAGAAGGGEASVDVSARRPGSVPSAATAPYMTPVVVSVHGGGVAGEKFELDGVSIPLKGERKMYHSQSTPSLDARRRKPRAVSRPGRSRAATTDDKLRPVTAPGATSVEG
eukprot:987667_1